MGAGWTNPWNDDWSNSDWHWRLTFAVIPHKMDNGHWLWLKEYYQGVRRITGPGEPVYLYQYMTPEEFTWFQLTQS